MALNISFTALVDENSTGNPDHSRQLVGVFLVFSNVFSIGPMFLPTYVHKICSARSDPERTRVGLTAARRMLYHLQCRFISSRLRSEAPWSKGERWLFAEHLFALVKILLIKILIDSF